MRRRHSLNLQHHQRNMEPPVLGAYRRDQWPRGEGQGQTGAGGNGEISGRIAKIKGTAFTVAERGICSRIIASRARESMAGQRPCFQLETLETKRNSQGISMDNGQLEQVPGAKDA